MSCAPPTQAPFRPLSASSISVAALASSRGVLPFRSLASMLDTAALGPPAPERCSRRGSFKGLRRLAAAHGTAVFPTPRLVRYANEHHFEQSQTRLLQPLVRMDPFFFLDSGSAQPRFARVRGRPVGLFAKVTFMSRRPAP